MIRLNLLQDKKAKARWSIGILGIIHLVGIMALSFGFRDVLLLTPLNLVFMVFLLLSNVSKWNLNLVFILILAYLSGMLVEIIGVSTGNIFGEYYYGKTMGIKFMGVPLVIGVNWMILAYCTGVISNRFPVNIWIKALVGSLLMVGLDFLIEPLAPLLDFWYWPQGSVPYENYLAWFIVSYILIFLFHWLKFEKTNQVAAPAFWIQVGFFGLLNLIL